MANFTISRRGLLKTTAVAGAGLATPVILRRPAYAYTNEPTGSTVTLGFNVPQSGPYADEGKDELLAYQLAVEHLNGEGDGGMLNTFSSDALQGNGVNGKKLEYVTGDTQTKSDAARASAKRMIERDGAVMITGGSSSGVAIAVQGLCQEMGVIFMAGLTHSNDTTGKDKKANGFRHFFNAYMSGAALAPVLQSEYGSDRKAYHLTADYTWGWTQEESIKAATEALGWETVNAVRTPLGAGDFSQYLTPVLNSDADVLILNHYGGDMVDSLTQAVQFGLKNKTVNGKNFEIVVPLYSRLMAQGAGEAVKGIFGSTNWHWSLQDEGSKAFVKSFGQKYGKPPSQAAHTCYVQTLLYADAAQRAGTFNPCGIVEALEGYEFDG
ncbi:MAG: substrate-binding protein, partial [Pseudomonadota bacterium]